MNEEEYRANMVVEMKYLNANLIHLNETLQTLTAIGEQLSRIGGALEWEPKPGESRITDGPTPWGKPRPQQLEIDWGGDPEEED